MYAFSQHAVDIMLHAMVDAGTARVRVRPCAWMTLTVQWAYPWPWIQLHYIYGMLQERIHTPATHSLYVQYVFVYSGFVRTPELTR